MNMFLMSWTRNFVGIVKGIKSLRRLGQGIFHRTDREYRIEGKEIYAR